MTTTPVPAGYNPVWSHSTLSSFDTCPRKFWAERIAKTAIQEIHPKTEWGTKVHQALEDHGKSKKPMPSNMVQYKPYAEKIAALAATAEEAHYEFKMGMTREYKPCDFDSSIAWGRAIADVLLVYHTKQTIIVIDTKTGKYRGRTDQPIINAVMAMVKYPNIEVVKTLFAYTNEDIMDTDTFYRSSVAQEFSRVQDKTVDFINAVKFQNFPARRSGLCRQYCGDRSCPFNGSYGK
jgi:hypothetical protein